MANSISRLEKLEKLDNPYPRDFPGRETIQYILDSYCEGTTASFKIAGRIIARRGHKENIFFDIFDQTGQIQLHARWEKVSGDIDDNFRNSVTNKIWNIIQEADIGDMVGVEGTIGENPRGEPLLLISNFMLLAKALKDPPANFHGVKNPEHRYRHREQDLLSSAETRELFKTRAEIVFKIRKYLNEKDFIEIETPILQPIYGGATARPFITQHNALSQQFYLAISSELYLKRALVGGFDRVYAFSRCFRNEGISPEHNPEFTNLEIFETCTTGDNLRSFVIDIIDHAAHSVGSLAPFPQNFYDKLPAQEWPLSRQNKGIAEAWELYIGDMEIASGASDLNDPREQEERLKESERKGLITTLSLDTPEYDPYDQNYIEALEMGALPWAGVGIGIDRLVMLLTGKTNIRDVIAFPTLRSDAQ